MANVTNAVCAINNCGKPFAPLEEGRTLQEEDEFRMCVEHEKAMLVALRKLRGDW